MMASSPPYVMVVALENTTAAGGISGLLGLAWEGSCGQMHQDINDAALDILLLGKADDDADDDSTISRGMWERAHQHHLQNRHHVARLYYHWVR